jgi:3-dehydroquinate dehydratase
MRKSKKSKFRSVTINKKLYYFYTIKWLDITGDSGHATEEEMLKLQPSKMVSVKHTFLKKTLKAFGHLLVMMRQMHSSQIVMFFLLVAFYH